MQTKIIKCIILCIVYICIHTIQAADITHEYIFAVFYNNDNFAITRDTIQVGQEYLVSLKDTRAGGSNVTLLPYSIEEYGNQLIEVTQQLVDDYGDKMMGIIGPTRTDSAMKIKEKFPHLIMFTSATGSNLTVIPPVYQRKKNEMQDKPDIYQFQLSVNDYDVASAMVDTFFSLDLKELVIVYKNSSEFSKSLRLDCQTRINILNDITIYDEIGYKNSNFEPVYQKLAEIKEKIKAQDPNKRLGVLLLNSQDFQVFFDELKARQLIDIKQFTYIVNRELGVEIKYPNVSSLLYLEALESPFYEMDHLLYTIDSRTNRTLKEVNKLLVENDEATFIYDSILSIYEVVHYEHHFVENDVTMKPQQFQSVLRSSFRVVDFIGTTGRVTYIDNGNRYGIGLRIFNVDENSKIQRVADWNMDKHLTWRSSVINMKLHIYLGGGKKLNYDNFFATTSSAIGNQWYVSPLYGVIPTVVSNFILSIDHQDKFIVLYGGRQGTQLHDDLYGFDLKLKRWFYLPSVSAKYPPAIELGMGTIVGSTFYLVGGRSIDLNIMDHMWEYSFKTYHWDDITQIVKKPDAPGPRIRGDLSTLTDHEFDGFAYFGGENPESLKKDVWLFNSKESKWIKYKRKSDDKIKQRASMVMEFLQGSFFIFGGRITRVKIPGESPQVNDFWIYRTADSNWYEIDNSKIGGANVPKPREGHRSIRFGGFMYVGFGYTSIVNDDAPNHYYGDLWKIQMDYDALSNNRAKWVKLHDFSNFVTPRSNLGLIQWDSKLIWFGGELANENIYQNFKTDMWMHNAISEETLQIHKPFDSPALVTSTTLMSFGSKVVIYGGRFSTEGASESAYLYDLEKNAWSQIEFTNTYGAYDGISSSYFSSTNYLHGGSVGNDYTAKTMNVDYSNGMLNFHDIQYDNKYTIARSHHAAVAIENLMYIIGGQSSSGPLNDIQLYDIFSRKWSTIYSKATPSPFAPPSLLNCEAVAQDKMIYISSCGRMYDKESDKVAIWSFNPQAKEKWAHYTKFKDDIYQGQSFIAIGKEEFFSFGGEVGEQTTRNTFQVRQKQIQVTQAEITSPEKPTARFDHRTVYYKNDVFVVSGTGGIIFKHNPDYSKASDTIITADSWIFHFGSPCNPRLSTPQPNCTQCAPGSYFEKDSCYPCKPGTYSSSFNSIECIKCDSGTYADKWGSFDKSFCLPCPAGEKNDKDGQGHCIPCDNPDLCPIGSTKELSSQYNISSKIDREIPPTFQTDPTTNKVMLGIQITFIIVGVIIPLLTYFIWRACPCIKTSHIQSMDFLFTNNHGAEVLRSEEPVDDSSSSEEDEGEIDPLPPHVQEKKKGVLSRLLNKKKKKKKQINVKKVKVIKKTVIGGLFTILAGAIYLQFIINDLIAYFSANSDVETVFLVPLVRFSDSSKTPSASSQPIKFYTNIESHLTIHGYKSERKCTGNYTESTNIRVNTYDIESRVNGSSQPNITLYCEEHEEDEYGQTKCACVYRCFDCVMTSTSGRLSWKFYDKGTYGSWIEYSAGTTTGYDLDRVTNGDPFSNKKNTMSTIKGNLVPKKGNLFRGTTPPIYVHLSAVSTLYVRTDHRFFPNINFKNLREIPSLFSKVTSKTGMHLDWKYNEEGQEVNENNFHTENGVRVDISFSRSTDGLLINRQSKKALGEYFASLLAQITGIVALVAIIMGIIEGVYTKLGFVNEEGHGTTTFKLFVTKIFDRLSSIFTSPSKDVHHQNNLEERLVTTEDYDPIDDDFPIPSSMRSQMIDNFETP